MRGLSAVSGVVACSLMAAVLAGAAGGCASSGGPVVTREITIPFSDAQREALAHAQRAPYTFQRGDVFAVESLYDNELRQDNIIVLPDGTATVAGVGRIPVAGRTLAEVQEAIADSLSRQFRDVKIDIVLRELAGPRVYVLGDVRNPGLYRVADPRAGVLGVLAEAGGLNDVAQAGSVILLRLQPDGYYCRQLDLRGLRDGKSFDLAAVDLQPFDIIYVTRSAVGDFAVFSRNLAASLAQYSRFILDVRQIIDPKIFRR